MKALNDLMEMLEDELKKIVKKGDITPTELDSAYKAVDVIKDIETIKAMKEAGEEWDKSSEEGYSQRRGGMRGNRGYSREGEYSREYSQYMPMYPYMNSYTTPMGGQSMDGMSNRGSYDGASNNRVPYNTGNSNEQHSYNEGMSNDGRRGRDGDSDGRYSEDSSYARGRDARGRYTSRDRGSYEGYSRHTEKERMIEKLEKMMDTASTEKERQAIMQCIDKLDD